LEQVVSMTGYNTRDVARMLGWTSTAVRSCVRDGYTNATKNASGHLNFSFQDLVVLRSVKALIDAGVSKARVRRAMGRLLEQLPEERTLAAVRVVADGDRVVVRDGDELWNAESGQRILTLDISALDSDAKMPIQHRPNPTEPDLSGEEWYQLGVDLEISSPKESKAAYRKALELAPRNIDAHLNLGRLLHEEGRLRSAEAQYLAALEERPDDVTALFNLAVALEDLGRPMEALVKYEQVVRLDSYYADAYFNIAGIYERLGKRAEALRHLKTYKSLTTD
jgi:tetratricopeptide (TPR) repeat protein